ncbi:MAG TPA: hypothetical protein VHI31_01600 [Actinomycetota bacterium]|nr:hypothetical protein [Actinomycetota bacterium]
MTPEAMERALDRAEDAVSRGLPLEGTGFWKAVAAARKDFALADRYADRIAAVDRKAFENGVRLRVPAGVGTALLTGASAAGVAAVLLAGSIDNRLLRSAVFLGALGALEVGTHSLSHWVVGRLMGMRFTYYFLGGPPPPRPGAKLDYASYLRVPPTQRAVMHGSGAVVTKIVPFALIPAARSLDLPAWVVYVLVIVGTGQIVTDVLLSTRSSDWKKVKRELRAAKGWVRA